MTGWRGDSDVGCDDRRVLDADEQRRWRSTAQEKRAVADDLLDLGHHADACLMYEQAVQLALKSLLRGVGRSERTHDLVRLAQVVEEEIEALARADLHDRPAELSRHYIPARYSDAYDEGTPRTHYRASDSARASETATALLAEVDRLWEAAVEAEREAAGPVEPDEGPAPGGWT